MQNTVFETGGAARRQDMKDNGRGQDELPPALKNQR
jgi:hypothetical protein